jgi:hypothetical protein
VLLEKIESAVASHLVTGQLSRRFGQDLLDLGADRDSRDHACFDQPRDRLDGETGPRGGLRLGPQARGGIKGNGARRVRACNRYMILLKPFTAWFEGLNGGDRLTMTKTTEAALRR